MRIIVGIAATCAFGLIATAAAGLANAQSQKLVMEEFMIPADDPGIQLYVRNKHLQGQDRFPANRVVFFVHGATYPSETVFDIDLPGGSWMDEAASKGYDTYLVDVRGYGRSTRPPAMSAPPVDNPPLATTAEAIKDVSSAVDFILKRRSISKPGTRRLVMGNNDHGRVHD